jgi:F-type H+-transporting ATPase subunit b
VALAMFVFLLILVWKKVPGLIVGGLDKQIVAIRKQLDEAKALRAEAEALRAEYSAKIANAERTRPPCWSTPATKPRRSLPRPKPIRAM